MYWLEGEERLSHLPGSLDLRLAQSLQLVVGVTNGGNTTHIEIRRYCECLVNIVNRLCNCVADRLVASENAPFFFSNVFI
jgi:hypothetical protein